MAAPVDVFILSLPGQNQEWFRYCLESLEREPITLHLLNGVVGHIGEGRRRGLLTGSAPYVAYVDPDDLVCRGAFSACVNALNTAPECVMAYTREARISEGGVLLAEWDRALYEPFFGTPDEAFRAHHLSVYRRAALPNLDFMLDYPTLPEQALKQRLWNNNFAFVDRVGYQWRRYQHSASTRIEDRPEHVRALLAKQNQLWKRMV